MEAAGDDLEDRKEIVMRLKADLKCPNPKCRRALNLHVDEMVPGRSKTCPHCKTEINFKGDDGRKVQKALDDLEKTLKGLSR